MPHGGKRNGSGRPKGATGKKTRIVIEKAEAGGAMPLDVMLAAMRESLEQGDLAAAASYAKDAAPYCHAKLASVEVGGKPGRPIPITIINAKRPLSLGEPESSPDQ